jgi:hypothetical protein
MTSSSGHPAPGPGAKIIPLTPGVARPTGARVAPMRDAVLQVISHLVIESVPEERQLPLFGQAADLLDQAGWGLDELYAAATEAPARDALLRTLGLLVT